ncbi:MAG: UbiA family prenyltransferase [Bacteroidia bacterium]
MFKQVLIATRFGNLVIMGLAQWLSLSAFTYYNVQSKLQIIVATVVIGFAGYIINDYFDQEIDKINRPDKNLFLKKRFRKWGFLIYGVLNLFGLAIGFLLDYKLLILFVAVIFLLLLYSWLFKGKAIIGNFIAALIQAAVFVPCFFFIDHSSPITPGIHFSLNEFNIWFLTTITGFAFLTAFFREWVKDIEDKEGDKSQGLATAAIIFSVNANKMALKVIAGLLILLVAAFTVMLFNQEFYQEGGVLTYFYLFLILPLSIRSLMMVIKQKEHAEWSRLSQWLKMLMLAGVLSIGII